MLTHLPRNHYEAVCEFLKRIRADEIFSMARSKCGRDPTYEEFIRSIIIPENISPNEEAQASNYANIYFHMYHMLESRDRLYYVTPNLAAKLAQTSLNIDSYFIRSPFREIFVQIDPGMFFIKDIDGSRVSVNGFYVYLKDFDSYKQLRIMACSLLKPIPEIHFNDSTFYFRFDIGPGKVMEQVKKIVAKYKKDPDELDKFGAIKNIDYIEDFFSFVLNVLLYITSKKPDAQRQEMRLLTSKKKIRKLIKEGINTKRWITICGSNIKDNNTDVEDIKNAGGIGAWKLMSRVKVSGHWRAQWYGSDKDGSKHTDIIWINDYEKGPEFADMVNSSYVVK